MKKNTKGSLEMEQFVKYFLVLLSFTLLVVFVVAFFKGLSNSGVEQACRTSVSLRTSLHFGKTITNVYPLECQTQEVLVPEEKLPRQLDEKTLKYQVYGEIADMMAKCWWMFGNGYYHNLLDDNWKNDNLCHVCYSFSINQKYTTLNEQPVTYTLEELNEYLVNIPYSPGLLQGGGSLVGDAGAFDFPAQTTAESSRESRKLTTTKILSSRIRNQGGLADFSDTFTGKEDLMEKVREYIAKFSNGGMLAPVFVIVPSLPEEELKDGSTLPIKLLQEWEIGDSILENGIVFIISLNDGKVLYATGYGTAGILYRNDIDGILTGRFTAEMIVQDPANAILYFIEDLKEHLETTDHIREKILFQQSYMGYITGGTRVFDISSDDKYYSNEDLHIQGSIAYEKDLTILTPGDYYAITYINTYWRSQRALALPKSVWSVVKGQLTGGGLLMASDLVSSENKVKEKIFDTNEDVPNMIGFTSYEGLLGNGICNTNLEEG